MYGHTFMEAWKSGIDEYREKSARGYIRPWSIADGRQRYQAGTVDSLTVQFPEVDGVGQLVGLDIERFLQRLQLPAARRAYHRR